MSHGQSNLNLKEIEKLTLDSTSEYYYSLLLFTFTNHPETLDPIKAKYLYYGKLYTKNYKLFTSTTEEEQFNRLVDRGKFKKAILLGEKILEENPTNLEILSKLSLCYKQIVLIKKSDSTITKLSILINAILNSGTGLEKENAYKVIAIGDEYITMALLGTFGISRQSLMKTASTIDSWEVKDVKSGKTSELHFEWFINLEQGTKHIQGPE